MPDIYLYTHLYTQSALPGYKNGVSGTIVIGVNIAISKYSTEEKKRAAAEFLKFISTKENRKKFIINRGVYSYVNELYDDEEVCSVINCNVIKGAEPLSSIDSDIDDFSNNNYIEKYMNSFYEYLFNDKNLNSVIEKIDNLLAVHSLSLESSSFCYLAVFILIIYLLLSTVMASSLVFLKKMKSKFKFLSNDFWIISVVGTIIFMSSVLAYLGKVTPFKCHIHRFLMSTGFILNLTPILIKLIIEYPEENSFTKWIKQKPTNKYIYLIVMPLINLILNGILILSPFDVDIVNVEDGENFMICVQQKAAGYINILLILLIQLFILISFSFLIYKEKNIEEIATDIKFLIGNLFIMILCFILYTIMNMVIIHNFHIYMGIFACIIFVDSLSIFFFTYAFRIFLIFTYNKEAEEENSIIKKITNNTKNMESSKSESQSISIVSSRKLSETADDN